MITLCQIHTDLINKDVDKSSVESEYYDAIWEKKASDGYWKPDAFWEIPLWIARMSAIFNMNGVEHGLDVIQSVNWYLRRGETYMFSVLDSNKAIIREIIKDNPRCRFMLGGYVDWQYFSDYLDRINIFSSIEDFCDSAKLVYNEHVSYHLFHGQKCIPRLTMSRGCKHKCKFCSISKGITEVYEEVIFQNVLAMCDHLKFKLIYIDDKTFGQAANHRSLRILYKQIKSMNPEFEGFIVQTTAAMACKMDFTDLGIFAVEIGVESFNDRVLRSNKKPASETLIVKAMLNIVGHGIKFIPNIIVGLPEETFSTYTKTYNFIEKYRGRMYLFNIYNLALYEGTELAGEFEYNDDDTNELNVRKSFYGPKKQQLDEAFSTMLFSNAITII